ncbi:MAG TPA: alpha/beta hydrolase [Thermoleophilaceae bacterium]|jgi:pimeloyl-ACP methyl ester carboxylesterase
MADSRSIVLVHGAWHGPWCWSKVVGPLRERGFDVHTPDNPSSAPDTSALGDLYDDAANLRRTVDAIDGEVIVVAHSYGGVVTTEGVAGAGNVAGIVYLTAFMLDEGESLFALVGGLEPDWWIKDADEASLLPGTPEEIFYNDCSPEDTADAVSRLEPQSLPAIKQPVRSVAWRDIPSTYVICEKDNAIPVFAQVEMSQRARDVRRLDTSHSPFLSQPDEVVVLLAELAA